jgi:hypothetical protein
MLKSLIYQRINIIYLFILSCNAQEPNFVNGKYDELQIVKNDNQKITGFLNYSENNIECMIFFKGIYIQGTNKIIVDFINLNDDSMSKGTLEINNKKITLKSDSFIFPCQRVFNLFKGENFFFSEKINYNELSIIKDDKVFLYDKNGDDYSLTKKKSYLLKNDLIVVDETIDDWVKIRFVNNLSKSYWIKTKSIW